MCIKSVTALTGSQHADSCARGPDKSNNGKRFRSKMHTGFSSQIYAVKHKTIHTVEAYEKVEAPLVIWLYTDYLLLLGYCEGRQDPTENNHTNSKGIMGKFISKSPQPGAKPSIASEDSSCDGSSAEVGVLRPEPSSRRYALSPAEGKPTREDPAYLSGGLLSHVLVVS
ncbi:hypothetical protein AVEN_214622-1 [Araneus ventricosus]|uniref:Uncharacterized protein n=1 Tax=Araneus ventricosus TaxID=182803 RepID=A0A4Y2GQ28_ARAVE|nr:hypothetical protein AVEN_214622-1 [Araneus ventricosus]